MTTKKIVSHVGASNVQPGPFGGGDPLPTALAPVPPSTVEAPVKRAEARRGALPRRTQIDGAPRAAEELRQDPDKYTEVFGARVPAAATLADSLEYSAGWSTALAAANRWRAYCAGQNRLAWGHSLGLLERLQPMTQALGSTAPADLPELTAVVTARSPSAKRAAATRKKNAAADAQALATPSTSTSTEAPTTTEVAATPTK